MLYTLCECYVHPYIISIVVNNTITHHHLFSSCLCVYCISVSFYFLFHFNSGSNEYKFNKLIYLNKENYTLFILELAIKKKKEKKRKQKKSWQAILWYHRDVNYLIMWNQMWHVVQRTPQSHSPVSDLHRASATWKSKSSSTASHISCVDCVVLMNLLTQRVMLVIHYAHEKTRISRPSTNSLAAEWT